MIGPVINATEAKSGFAMQYLVYCQLHAINRGTGALVCFYISEGVYGMKTQGLTNGNGMTHTGLRLIGCYHHDLSKVFYCFYKVADTGGGNAIIIGYQYHRFLLFGGGLFLFRSGFLFL